MVRESFTLFELKSKAFPFIVYSLDYSTMSNYILDVEKELREKSFKGEVLFDLLLSNGINDRYYSLPFNGSRFEYKLIRRNLKVPAKVVSKTNEFYKKNIQLLDNGILTKFQKFKFENSTL